MTTTDWENPVDAIARLVGSIDPAKQVQARRAFARLLRWTERHSATLTFHRAERDNPAVRFDTLDGNAFWIGRGSTGGDAKVELLTRTAKNLPAVVVDQLKLLGSGLFPPQAYSGAKVLQVCTSDLDDDALRMLESMMEFALGVRVGIQINVDV